MADVFIKVSESMMGAQYEAELQIKARTLYPYVPTVYSVNGSQITMEKISGLTLQEHLSTLGYRDLSLIMASSSKSSTHSSQRESSMEIRIYESPGHPIRNFICH